MFEDSLTLYKTSLVCLLRVLGNNHKLTAEVYMDLGNLYLKMRDSEQSTSHFEKAYEIY